MVFIGETPQNLQKMLDTLYDYCNEWKFKVNLQKTKIVAFRNGRKLRNTENSRQQYSEMKNFQLFNCSSFFITYVMCTLYIHI